MSRSRAKARRHLRDLFPGLRAVRWRITSDCAPHYNCTAWASHDTGDRWEPYLAFWLADIPKDTKPATLIRLFEKQGYELCQSRQLEAGTEKVAIYLDQGNFGFTHVARQTPTGEWTSKIGILEDIEHPLAALEGAEYGTVRIVMRRTRGD